MERRLYKKTKWLNFYIVEEKPKTVVIHVINTSNQFLGEIKWDGPWRQYTYNIDGEIKFNNRCLSDIASVLTSLNNQHKKNAA